MTKFFRQTVATTISSLLVFGAVTPVFAEPSAELIEAAKKEGQLTTIALPHDWCGYGAVIDVGLSFGPTAKADGLLQPYKVSTWSTIPDSAKDADGYWYGDYYGALAFEVNKDIVPNVPQDWSDLLKSDYKNAVALAGDPRSSAQAIQGVYAAGLS